MNILMDQAAKAQMEQSCSLWESPQVPTFNGTRGGLEEYFDIFAVLPNCFIDRYLNNEVRLQNVKILGQTPPGPLKNCNLIRFDMHSG